MKGSKPGKGLKDRSWLRSLLIGLLLSSVLSAVYLHKEQRGDDGFDVRFLEQVENYIYDRYLRTIPYLPPSDEIIIVDIDEASLAEYGEWPWQRYLLAGIINELARKGAASITLEIVLYGADRSSPEFLSHNFIDGVDVNIPLENIPEEYRDYDVYLGKAIAKTSTVLGFYAWFGPEHVHYADKPGGLSITHSGEGDITLLTATSADFPVPALYRSGTRVGFTNVDVAPDGVIRTTPLVMELDGGIYPSLALATVMQAKNIQTATLNHDESGFISIRAGDYIIPVNGQGRMRIPFKGVHGSYRYISAKDVLQGNVGAESIEGKIVFIGSSAEALQNVRSTPWDRLYPGVEVHATVVDSILNNNYIYAHGWTAGFQVIAILFFGVLSALMFCSSRLSVYLPMSAAVILLVFYISYRLMLAGIYFTPLYVVIIIAAQATVILSIRFWQEERHKRFIQSAFGKYVAPEVVNSIALRDRELLKGQEKVLSILFSDIRDFTSISENLNPQQVLRLLNKYFTPMTAITKRNRGTVDKFIGDSLMVFWNAPLDVENHARMALLSAAQMHRALAEINPAIEAEYGLTLSMGVGIHSGAAYIGNIGSDDLLNYTIIGDSVNIASRLEGLCSVYGADTIVSADTKALCEASGADCGYRFIFMDSIIVKGRHNALDIYMPLSNEEYEARRGELELYERARQAYVDGDFITARELFTMLMPLGRTLYDLYYVRTGELMERRPDEWDGVWRFVTK